MDVSTTSKSLPLNLKAQESEKKNSSERVQQWFCCGFHASTQADNMLTIIEHFFKSDISVNAGHGFHLRLTAQNSKEPRFLGLCAIKQ